MIPPIRIVAADCLDFLKTLEPASIDACVTDPPYELGFMGKRWDNSGIAYRVELWALVLRALKPGAYLFAFGGTRTHHRMVCAVEDAGFEIRDEIAWLYGSGFPKSKNLPGGRGTALKPAQEPICVARKPFKGSVAACVLQNGTGALNIDAARIPLENGEDISIARAEESSLDTAGVGWGFKSVSRDNKGRWPANVAHDGSEIVVAAFPEEAGASANGPTDYVGTKRGNLIFGKDDRERSVYGIDDRGSAARFFYCAKPSTSERDAGLEDFVPGKTNDGRATSIDNAYQRGDSLRRNTHPTVKPVALMRWLVRLGCPAGGIVLDPFVGSGTTACAAAIEGFRFVGCDLDPEHVRIATARASDSVGPLFAKGEVGT